MSWHFVQSAISENGSSASARTVAFNSATASGNFLAIAVISFNTGITVTVSDNINGSWTQAGTYAVSGGERASIWYFPNSGAGSITVTVTPSAAAFLTIIPCEYSNIVTVSPLDSVSTTSSGTSSTPTTGTITVNNTEDLVFGAIAFGLAFNTVTGAAESAIRGITPTNADQPGAAVDGHFDANGSVGLRLNSSTAWVALGASFKSVASGGSGSAPNYGIRTGGRI